jgi:hypothetical protein
MNDRSRRSTLNDTSKGIEGTVKEKLREKGKVTRLPSPQRRGGNTEEGEQRNDIFQGVDEGSTRDSPSKRGDDLASGASHITVTIANLMSLVQDDTVPLDRVKERRIGIQLLIIRDVDSGTFAVEEASGGIQPLGRVACPDTVDDLVDDAARLGQHGDPGVEHGEGSEQQRSRLKVVDNDRGNLDGLTEPHVITLESTTNKNGIGTLTTRDLGSVDFLVEHPLDTVELVGEVGEVLPQRVEGGRHEVGVAVAKKRESRRYYSIFFYIAIWISKPTRKKRLFSPFSCFLCFLYFYFVW